MDLIFKAIAEWAQGQSIGTLLILFALVFTYQKNKKDRDEQMAENRLAWDRVETERRERWEQVRENMEKLSKRADDCEGDRRKLWQGMFRLGLKAKGVDGSDEPT